MSRIGRAPVTVPAGVTVTVGADNVVTVKGAKGTLTQSFSEKINIKVEDNAVVVTRNSELPEERALHGLTRALISNMVIGVSAGYEKKMTIEGVGYRAEKKGKQLVLTLGYSHLVYFEDGEGITFTVPDERTIIVSGIDKQLVGQVAAQVRGKRPPEPYKGKGIRYEGEHIRRKAGKSGK